MPRATTPTVVNRAIGPQDMPCLTLTGAIFLPAGRLAVAGRLPAGVVLAAPVVLRAGADLRGLALGLAVPPEAGDSSGAASASAESTSESSTSVVSTASRSRSSSSPP